MRKPVPARKVLNPEACATCAGCGHFCSACLYPVSLCFCDLDTEQMAKCDDCGGTGEKTKRTAYQQYGYGKA